MKRLQTVLAFFNSETIRDFLASFRIIMKAAEDQTTTTDCTRLPKFAADILWQFPGMGHETIRERGNHFNLYITHYLNDIILYYYTFEYKENKPLPIRTSFTQFLSFIFDRVNVLVIRE